MEKHLPLEIQSCIFVFLTREDLLCLLPCNRETSNYYLSFAKAKRRFWCAQTNWTLKSFETSYLESLQYLLCYKLDQFVPLFASLFYKQIVYQGSTMHIIGLSCTFRIETRHSDQTIEIDFKKEKGQLEWYCSKIECGPKTSQIEIPFALEKVETSVRLYGAQVEWQLWVDHYFFDDEEGTEGTVYLPYSKLPLGHFRIVSPPSTLSRTFFIPPDL